MRVFAFAPTFLVTIGFVTAAAALPTINSVRNQLTPTVKSGTPDDHTVSNIVDRSGALSSIIDTKLRARQDDNEIKKFVCEMLGMLQFIQELEPLHSAISDLSDEIGC